MFLITGIINRISAIINWFFRLWVFNFGWLYVLYIHLPIEYVKRFINVRLDWIKFKSNIGGISHGRKVAQVQRQINKWHKLNEGKPHRQRQRLTTSGIDNCQQMCFTRPEYKKGMYKINLDNLCNIVELNTSSKFVRVEPKVSIDQLQRALLPLGYTLPVVPEIGDLQIGGLVLGAGISSSSAKNGLFQHSCLAYEIVTTSGELITAEREGSHQSLFFGIPWSLGSLGFLVSITLKIRECPPYIRLQYQPCFSTKELTGRMEELIMKKRTENEFVEAIQYDKECSVLISGTFIDKIPRNDRNYKNNIGRWYKPFFYLYVKKMLESGGSKTEYISTKQYFTRHWRSLFWELRSILPSLLLLFPFRWIIGWFLPLSLPFPKTCRVRRLYSKQHVLQNIMVPLSDLQEALKLVDKEMKIYPLWLCPFHLTAHTGLVRNQHGLKLMYVNIGIYGQPRLTQSFDEEESSSNTVAEKIKTLEGYLREVKGFQMLCSDSHQNAAEFWEMFDAALYDWLRAKYDCKVSIPSVFEKVYAENRTK
uniref:Delta(24)-sterol reductase n=1 Tax=Meloidogyne javanica TaxID=6303 RepID=A0A915MQY1_MELJA